jgi:hypothetical protein
MKNELIQPAATLAAAQLQGKGQASFTELVNLFMIAYQALEQAERDLGPTAKPAGPSSDLDTNP